MENIPQIFEKQKEISDIDKILEEKNLSPEQRYAEMAKLLKESEKIIDTQKKEGNGLIGQTIKETFQEGKISEFKTDRYFYLLPKQEKGNLIVISDLHGDIESLKIAAKMLKNKDNHLLSLGDNIVTAFSDEYNEKQAKVLDILLKLFTKYPDRVHLCRGNCEVDIAPAGGIGVDIYGEQGIKGFKNNLKRVNRLFNKTPLGFITETGAIGVHGLLPRGVKQGGEKHYRNLKEINEFSDYLDESKFSGREVNRMLWGEIDENSENEFRKGEEGMVSGKEGVLKSLDAVGAKVLLRGHQHSLAKRKGGAKSIDFDNKVGTVISHKQKNERRIAIIPLDKDIKELSEEMFQKVD